MISRHCSRVIVTVGIVLFPLLAAIGSTPASAQPKPSAVASVDESEPVSVPAPSELAIRYYESGNILWVVNTVWGIVLPLALLFTGVSARIRTWAQAIGRRWFFVIVTYLLIFIVLTTVIELPLAYYQEFVRPHAYGLSNQTLSKWVTDSLKSLMVAWIIGSSFLWVPYLLLARSPRRWWLYTAAVAIPFSVVVNLIAPIWIAPLYNRFEPMRDKTLEARLLQLADRVGIEGGRVYEVNKSIDTNQVNAYVAGLFGTKRIVLWDTILAKLTPEELVPVMAHEMGHYVLGHVVRGLAFSSALLLAALWVAHRLVGFALTRFGTRFGFTDMGDIASLPLLLVLIGLFSLAVSPMALAFSRHQEHEADRFALEITRANHSMATAFVKLQLDNLAVPRPGPVFKLWRATHPPIGERIDFSNSYRPWTTGQGLAYARYFKGE